MANIPRRPGHDSAVGAHLAPTAPTAPTPPPAPHRSIGKRWLGVIAALALVLGPAVVGYQIGQSNDSSSNANSALTLPQSNSQSNGSQSNSSGNGTSSSI